MKKIEDLTGKTLGRWKILRRLLNREKSKAVWLCRCACGKEKEVYSTSLSSGKSVSCGCFRVEIFIENNIARSLPPGEAALNYLYRQYKGGAAKRQLEFSLSKEYFYTITKQPCEYCGVLPLQVLYNGTRTTPYLYNGVDRIDNNKGYVKENCVPCCTVCNLAKGTMTIEQFKEWIARVVKFNIVKVSS